MKSSLVFSEVEQHLSALGKIYGFDLSKKPSAKIQLAQWARICVLTSPNIIHMVINLGLAVYEHQHHRSNELANFIFIAVEMSVLSNVVFTFCLFCNQDQVREMMGWCRGIYQGAEGLILASVSQGLLKIMTFMKWILIFDYFLLNSGVILTKVLTGENIFLTPYYKEDEFVQEPRWYGFLLVIQFVGCGKYLLDLATTLGFYVVFISHVVAKLHIICETLGSLSEMDPETRLDTIKDIVRQHSDVIDKLETLNTLFSIPLATSEISCISCFILTGLIVMLDQTKLHVAFASSVVLFIYVIYSVVGQKLTTSSLEISEALYDTNWYEMDPTHQKMLLMVGISTQRELGVSVCGVGTISHMRLQQIMRLGYDITLTIMNIVK